MEWCHMKKEEERKDEETKVKLRKVKEVPFAPRALMSVEEVAQYLNLSTQTIYNWLHKRRITGIKIGKVWRFDKQEIDSWLKGKKFENPSVEDGQE